MTQPTQADLALAEQVAENSQYRGQRVLVKQIAQALADQRAGLQREFEEQLADEYQCGRDAAYNEMSDR